MIFLILNLIFDFTLIYLFVIFNIKNVKVVCQDKGALDYTIKARLVTALTRMEVSNA